MFLKHYGVEVDVGVFVGVLLLAGVVLVGELVGVRVDVEMGVDPVVVDVAVAGTTLITTVSRVPKYCPWSFCNLQLPV